MSKATKDYEANTSNAQQCERLNVHAPRSTSVLPKAELGIGPCCLPMLILQESSMYGECRQKRAVGAEACDRLRPPR